MLAYAQAYILAGVVQRTMYALRESVESKIHRLPLSYIDRQSRGDLLSRVTNDIDNLAQSLQQTVSQILTSLLTLIGVTVVMFTISPLLAVVALVTVPMSLWMMKVIGEQGAPPVHQRSGGTPAASTVRPRRSSPATRSSRRFGRQRDVEERFAADNDELYKASFGAQFMSGMIQPLMVFFGNIQFVLIAVVGGLRISSGAISVGDVQAMIQYARQFSMPLTQLASMSATFQSGIASLERVVELLDAPDQLPDDDRRAARRFQSAAGSCSTMCTSRIGRTSPLIEGLDVVAEPGQTIAIVGPTGAGKTTIVNLLMRFYELDSGTITLDGRDITTIPRSELRSDDRHGAPGHVAVRRHDPRQPRLREPGRNGGRRSCEAARVTYVDRFVRSLPDGYDTVINDEGDNVSAGEKQLITIARAFLADPAILILDEATSSVDTRTEVLIQEAMNALRQDRTSFVIAHRLSTIRGADVILVMDEGRIVEQGNHDELLAARRPLRPLYNAQFAGQAT